MRLVYTPPEDGEAIRYDDEGSIVVPDRPIIPYIVGDGIGVDIWPAAKMVIDAAVAKAYRGGREIKWMEVLAGERALEKTGALLPDETLEAITKYHIAIKGPLTTPVGGGHRSVNVALRQRLVLYACIRPVSYLPGVPSPVKHPEKVDMVVFRENMEDVYAGIEWPSGSTEAEKVIKFIRENFGCEIPESSGIGIKPMSPEGSRRLVRMAIKYAIRHGLPSVTLVHKGNVMKYTEGAFKDWGYQEARENFDDVIITEKELQERYGGRAPEDKIVIKDRIADAMFQQILLRPDEYSVLAMPNLNGDYMSDALAAQVGGLGMAPGVNMGDRHAVFEATHGSAPKYAGRDVSNPCSLILSGAMMLDHMGWREAADAVRQAVIRTISQKRVTYDLARQMEGATELKCSEFARAVVENIDVA